jgi:hypothetical protein
LGSQFFSQFATFEAKSDCRFPKALFFSLTDRSDLESLGDSVAKGVKSQVGN